ELFSLSVWYNLRRNSCVDTEGKIIHFDHSTKQIELELLSAYQAPVEPGKFDLVYQNADGSESVEYAVSRGSRVTERWDSLLEPRLVVGNLS
uniref:Uncharacterized protein n=1 Tax=Oncorhynchus tshawytscha TaxID=74940 RepID=A0AAZ3RJQ4_ONCTS